VRVRPRYAKLYSELPADRWVQAGELAAMVLQRIRAESRFSLHRRMLDEDYFEFRGGADEDRPPGARTRRTDVPGGDPTR
jgi:hypothetical protein